MKGTRLCEIVPWHSRGGFGARTGPTSADLKKLSTALKERIGAGVLGAIPEAFRRFYLEFKGIVPESDKRRTVFSASATEEIRQTLFSELAISTGEASEASVPALFLQRLPLGWSH